ncbi:MAG TPA: S-layer homology domain-containing protein [Chloroflexia bacterium]|jgi:hypothetical protein
MNTQPASKSHLLIGMATFAILILLLVVPSGASAVDLDAASTPPGKDPSLNTGNEANASCGVALWRTVPTPNVGGLIKVDDVAPDNIWALGTRGIVHWDGNGWSEMPWPGSASVTLTSIDAVDLDDVWVVGFNNTDDTTLAIHWDGTAWTTVATPNAANGKGHLLDVAGIEGNDVWAAGNNSIAGSTTDKCGEGLLLHWDGSQWTVEAQPSSCDGTTYYDAFVPGRGHLWLEGIQWLEGIPGTMNRFEAFVVNWPTTESYRGRPYMEGLGGSSPDDVWAVGYVPSMLAPVVLHYDGSTFTIVPADNNEVSYSLDVDSLSANDAWVVSSLDVSHWNGTGWTMTAVADPPAQLSGILAAGPDDIWVVGNDGSDNSLIKHYSTQSFHDVYPTSTFFPYVECLACNHVISGYPCGGPGEPCDGSNTEAYFRPNDSISRGQIAKIVAIAAGFDEDPGPQAFQDVAQNDSPFYDWINRLAHRGVMSGYPCDANADEPCVHPNDLPYFRPGDPTSRGQLAKIVSNAAGFEDEHTGQTYQDVPQGHPFYIYIERLSARAVMGGYKCGDPGEECLEGNRPYFRSANEVTRGQASKIVSNTFFPACNE